MRAGEACVAGASASKMLKPRHDRPVPTPADAARPRGACRSKPSRFGRSVSRHPPGFYNELPPPVTSIRALRDIASAGSHGPQLCVSPRLADAATVAARCRIPSQARPCRHFSPVSPTIFSHFLSKTCAPAWPMVHGAGSSNLVRNIAARLLLYPLVPVQVPARHRTPNPEVCKVSKVSASHSLDTKMTIILRRALGRASRDHRRCL